MVILSALERPVLAMSLPFSYRENSHHCHRFHIPGVTFVATVGGPKAITAMAHRIARLVYRMLNYGQQYIDKGGNYYEQRYRNQQLQFLRKKGAQLGFQLTEAEAQTA
jgi:hypothetical protein